MGGASLAGRAAAGGGLAPDGAPRALERLPLVWAGLWAAASLAYVLPGVPAGFRQSWGYTHQDLLLAPLMAAAAYLRWRSLPRPERGLWLDAAAASIAFWLANLWGAAVRTLTVPEITHYLVEDAAYLGFYVAWLAALARDPELERAAHPVAARFRRLETAAAGVLLAALAAYFVFLPGGLDPAAYVETSPAMFLYVTLDLVLLAGFLRKAAAAPDRTTARATLWLAAAWAGWALLDGAELLSWLGVLPIPDGTPLDALWALPQLAVVAAAARWPVPARAASPRPPAGDEPVPTPFLAGVGLVTAATVALPLVHLAWELTGLGANTPVEVETLRRWVVFVGLALLAPLLVAEHAAVRRWLVEVERQRRREREAVLVAQRFQALGQIAGGIAHEFNNLLQAVRANADLIALKTGNCAELEAHVGALARCASRGAAMTSKLLAFSRRQRVELRPLRLQDLVSQQVPVLQKALGEEIAVEADLDRDAAPVLADAGELEQVLLNLAINARDAMPSGGRLRLGVAEVTLGADFAATRPWARTGRFVALTVEDTGEGMPREVLERVFEPFFTTKPVGKGTGLGLSYVYGMVKQHGGLIDIQSEPGKGTRVAIYLPRASQDATTSSTGLPALRPPRFEGKALLVEDDTEVRRHLAEALRALGLAVTEAASVPEALSALEASAFAVVISDLVMPRWSGTDLVEWLAANRPGLPAVLITGHAEETVLRHLRGREDVRLLRKPVSLERLAAALSEVLPARG